MIEYRTGDILKDEAEAVVNTVNCMGVMGRGIALQFKKAFPEQRAPVGVRTRLESEVTKLRAMTGGGEGKLPNPQSALLTLHGVLSAIPAGLRFRLEELAVGPQGLVFIEAEVRDPGDGAQFVSALERGGLEVDPPSTRQLSDDTFTITIDAEVPDRASQEPGDAP